MNPHTSQQVMRLLTRKAGDPHAPQEGKRQEDHLGQHPHGDEARQAPEAGRRHRLREGREIQEEEVANVEHRHERHTETRPDDAPDYITLAIHEICRLIEPLWIENHRAWVEKAQHNKRVNNMRRKRIYQRTKKNELKA